MTQQPTIIRIATLAFMIAVIPGGCDNEPDTDGATVLVQTETRGLVTPEKESNCCNCDYANTATFIPEGDFQCSFDYPAHWEAKYDPWENMVYVQAPRCAQRCDGARTMSFTISTGRDNNATTEEQAAMAQDVVTHIGSVTCGGRRSPVFRPPGTTPDGKAGIATFHVGNHDGNAYDARAQFSCPNAGEWQKLEVLFLESVK